MGIFGSSLPSVRLLSKVFPSPKRRRLSHLQQKNTQRNSEAKKDIKTHTAAAAQARQEGLVHSVTHRGKGIEVIKIRRGEPAGHEGDKKRLI